MGRFDKLDQDLGLNLFTIATRRTWEIRNFANFNRHRTLTNISESQRMPILVNGIWGAETDWTVRMASNSEKNLPVGGKSSTSSDNSLQVRVNTFTRSAFTLGTSFAVEHSRDSFLNETTALDLGVETNSTGRFSRQLSMSGSYHIKSVVGKDAAGTSTNNLNHDLLLNLRYAPVQTVSIALSQRVQVSNGASVDVSANSTGQPVIGTGSDGFTALGANRDQNLNTFQRSNTSLDMSWEPVAKFSAGLRGSYDLFVRPGQPNDYFASTDQRLSYRSSSWTLSMSNGLAVRNDGVNPQAMQFEHYDKVQYRPSNAIDSSLAVRYSRVKSTGQSSSFLSLVQNARYTFNAARGMNRRLGELVEEFTVTQNNGDFAGEVPTRKTIQVSGRYYPTTRLSLVGSAALRFNEASIEQVYSAGVGLNMKIMDTSVDYAYAKRDADNRIEKRLSATMRKTF
jgi:hypothetical protein